MTHDTSSPEHHALARLLAERGFRVVIAYGQGGFRVRNPDLTRPQFVDERGFIPFRKAKVLFTTDRSRP